MSDTREEAREKGRAAVGRSFTIVLPVRVGDELREYRFRFTATERFRIDRTLYA